MGKPQNKEMVSMKVKVAAIQTKTFLEADEQTRNIEKAREYIAEAAEQGAKFICFPETYPGPWKAPLSYSPVEPLREMARKHDVYIVAGANCPVPGNPERGYTSQILVGPDGSVGRYNRTIPKGPWIYKGGRFWDYDYQEGDDLPVFNTPFGTVGILICSEVYVPELSRLLALKGAEILFLPAGVCKYELHATWRNLIWSRAIENLAYTVTCQNILGAEHGLAMICSPEEIIVESTKPGIFIAECDIDRIRWLRKETDLYGPPMPWNTKPGVLRDWRRSDVYRKNYPDW
jgi:predicted amidohydrolase